MPLAFDFPSQSRNVTSVFPGDFPGHVQHSLTPPTCCRLKCAEYSPKSQGLFSAACWKASPFGHRISRGCDKLSQREHPASLLEYLVICSLGAISFTVFFFFNCQSNHYTGYLQFTGKTVFFSWQQEQVFN